MIHPIDLTDDDVWSTLSASRAGDLNEVTQLVSRRPELVRCEYNYTPPLHFAVREGHLEVVRFLLEHGADPTYRTYPFQDSLLIMAQDREHHDVADLLMEILSRRFPVMEGFAARWGQRDMVAFLLAKGADPNKSGAPWATPLAWAQKKGRHEIEADLHKAGARHSQA